MASIGKDDGAYPLSTSDKTTSQDLSSVQSHFASLTGVHERIIW